MGSNDIDSAIELLQSMVRIDSVTASVSGNLHAEAELCGHLEAVARSWDLHCERLPVPDGADQLLICGRQRAGRPLLLFDSHLDTVGVEGMTVDPFAACCRSGRIYGRGACDTKASGAAMLWALKICDANQQRANNAAVLFSVDEEGQMKGMRSFVETGLGRLETAPSGIIVGEPTGLRPVIAHNGVLRLRIETAGVAAHSSDPAKGCNAIVGMVELIQHLESDYISVLTASHPLTGTAACSVTQIHGGTAANVIPDHCWAAVDRRTLPSESNGGAFRGIERVLSAAAAGLPGRRIDYAVTQTFDTPAMCPDVARRFLGPVQGALSGRGLPVEPRGVPFATHGGILTGRGLPAVVLGPGDIAMAHTSDESVSVREIEQAVEVYAELICRSAVG